MRSETETEMFKRTDDHPDGEAAPCTQVQLHHEVDVDENTEQGQPGEQRDLERREKWKMKGTKYFKIGLNLLYVSLRDRNRNRNLFSAFSGFDSYLEGEGLFALRLPPDDDDADATEQSQNDTGHHHGWVPGQKI